MRNLAQVAIKPYNMGKGYYVIPKEVSNVEPSEENTTTMSSKGQVTIPQFIREKLRLSPGDKFVWELLDTGEMRVRRLDPLEAMHLTIGSGTGCGQQ